MDMVGYTPSIFHAFLAVVLCVMCMFASVYVPKGNGQTALYIGALAFFVIGAIIMWMLAFNATVEAEVQQTQAITAFGLMLAHENMTDEKLEMLALRFPKLRYKMARGEVQAFFESTKVKVSHFRQFLATSNSEFISPERDWCTAEMPRAVWLEIFHWLEDHDKIIPDSAAGSHSWRWVGNSYQQMCAYWMAGRKLVDLSKVERIANHIDNDNVQSA